MNSCTGPSRGKVGKLGPCSSLGTQRGAAADRRGQPRVAPQSPWRFLKRVCSSEPGPSSPPGLNNSWLPPLPFWNFSAVFLPTCFQFALVASFDGDLNQRQRVRGDRQGEGEPRRKRAEGVMKGGRALCGVGPAGRWLCAELGWFRGSGRIVLSPFCGPYWEQGSSLSG